VTLHASSLVESRWFQLLAVFVGFNTIVYAAFALGKLWPADGADSVRSAPTAGHR
jgi:hypothetical protein